MSNRVHRRGSRTTGTPPLRWIVVDDTSRVGELNAYDCPECDAPTVTIDVDPGVTPMFLGCRATVDCTGTAVSRGYQRIHSALVPSWEWYRPTERQARRMSSAMYDHVAQGGLDLRRIET